MREHAAFRELQIQLSMLAAVYGRRGDEAGEMSRANYVHDCHALEFGFYPRSSWDHLRILSMVDRYLCFKNLLWQQCGRELGV